MIVAFGAILIMICAVTILFLLHLRRNIPTEQVQFEEYTVSVLWEPNGAYSYHNGFNHWEWRVVDVGGNLIATGYSISSRQAFRHGKRKLKTILKHERLLAR